MSCSWVTSTIVWPVAVQPLEQGQDLLAGGAVEVARGLVGQEDARLVHQRAGDGHPLPLAARELVGPVLHPVAQPHPAERLRGLPAPLLRAQAGVDQRQLHVVQRGGAGQQVERLEDEADLLVPDPGERVVAQLRHPVAVEPVLAARRAVEAADQVHQRGLAGARRSHDRDELVLPDRDVHAAEGAHHLAAHVVLALEIPGDDDGVTRNVRREHGHPFGGIGDRAAHRFRPISASSDALARR